MPLQYRTRRRASAGIGIGVYNRTPHRTRPLCFGGTDTPHRGTVIAPLAVALTLTGATELMSNHAPAALVVGIGVMRLLPLLLK